MAKPGPKRGSWLLREGWNPKKGTWDEDSPARKVITAVRNGSFLTNAAQAACLHRDTPRRWRALGSEHSVDELDREDIDINVRAYTDFFMQLEHAEGQHKAELVGLALQAARQEPRFALELLSRRYHHWNKSSNVSIDEPPRPPPEDRLERYRSDPRVAACLAALQEAVSAHETSQPDAWRAS